MRMSFEPAPSRGAGQVKGQSEQAEDPARCTLMEESGGRSLGSRYSIRCSLNGWRKTLCRLSQVDGLLPLHPTTDAQAEHPLWAVVGVIFGMYGFPAKRRASKRRSPSANTFDCHN